jgi:hypothetical protein
VGNHDGLRRANWPVSLQAVRILGKRCKCKSIEARAAALGRARITAGMLITRASMGLIALLVETSLSGMMIKNRIVIRYTAVCIARMADSRDEMINQVVKLSRAQMIPRGSSNEEVKLRDGAIL